MTLAQNLGQSRCRTTAEDRQHDIRAGAFQVNIDQKARGIPTSHIKIRTSSLQTFELIKPELAQSKFNAAFET